jgi:hypothetical protein
MVAPAVQGIDLFKIAGRSISGWIPSLKTGTNSHVRQPFCSQLEERLLLWLEYNPQVASYARGDIGPQFATTYRLPTPKNAPFAIGYAVNPIIKWLMATLGAYCLLATVPCLEDGDQQASYVPQIWS